MKLKQRQRQSVLHTFRFKVVAYASTVVVLSVLITFLTTSKENATAGTVHEDVKSQSFKEVDTDSVSQLIVIEKK